MSTIPKLNEELIPSHTCQTVFPWDDRGAKGCESAYVYDKL